MPNTHVAIRPRYAPAPAPVVERRSEAARKLADLGMLDTADGQVNTTVQDGWLAMVGGAEFPVAAYEVRPDDETDEALVTLVVVADSVQVSSRPGTAQPEQDKPQQVATWGQAGRPDPREGIPGWEPETLSEQVARQAEARA